MKIVMVGPVYPYKGGIAHYMGMMCKTFAKKHEVIALSYKMQYPKFMYKKEQKDYESDTFKVDGTNYCINTANPFNWVHVAKKINKLSPDLVVFQWWHPYFAPCYQIICSLLKTKEILFVCHNVFPHERFPMDRLLTQATLKKGKYYIVHSKLDEVDLLSVKKDARYKKAVIPTYNVFNKSQLEKDDARKILNVAQNEFVLLFFGLIREYNGLKYLLKALSIIKNKIPNVKLYIVGDFGGEKDHYLKIIKDLNIENYILIEDAYVSDDDVEKYFTATDMVILPYESATQSGIVQIAYEFLKPVVVTNVGGLPEVVADGKTGYVVPPFNAEELGQAIVKFYECNDKRHFEKEIENEAYKFSWDRMNEILDEIVEGGN